MRKHFNDPQTSKIDSPDESSFRSLEYLRLQLPTLALKKIWAKIGTGSESLRHLSLNLLGLPSHSLNAPFEDVDDGGSEPFPKNWVFPSVPPSSSLRSLSLESLDISFKRAADLRTVIPHSFRQLTDVRYIRRISISNCWNGGTLLRDAASEFHSLRSLKLLSACDMVFFNQILRILPRPLEVLAFDGWCDEMGRPVEKEAMMLHQTSLRKFFFRLRRFRKGPLELRTFYGIGTPNAVNQATVPFTITDLIQFTKIEELAIAIFPTDAYELIKLPNLKALSILNYYYDSRLDWDSIKPRWSIWEVVQRWVRLVELVELKSSGQSSFVIPRQCYASKLKVVELQSTRGWPVTAARRFMAQTMVNGNGYHVTTINSVSQEDIRIQHPEIGVFDVEDEDWQGYFWETGF
ncbi:hypothetical protein H072_7786 [Dactylellina haptotyla CBS 200.50]|uniref:Uncharacterized protein n=1 Tax=Dactylellina haptotyla (strain CBS 200.50) TaxID=1284197 RepID=S8A634_DACHA|nr:hypothetical protein H072_7786 [Dactylellina haptotyla CBS 200.50]